MTEDATPIEEHVVLEHEDAAAPDAPPAAPALPPDVHPSLAKHVMSAREAQAAAAKAVEEHDKAAGKTRAEQIARDAADVKSKMLAKLKERHGERFSHSITSEKDGSLTLHSFVMFEGTRRIATARKLTADEVKRTSPEELVAHEAAQLHTLATLTGA